MKAVLYARVSSKDQEQEGYSIPAQIKLLRDYARDNSIKIVSEFVEAETAKRAGRDAFNRMMRFLENHPDVRTVLCEKTDRLYRNFKDYVTVDELNLELHFAKEGEIISKGSRSHQKLTHGIKVLLAKNYIDNLSEETSKGMREKAEQGLFPSYAPLGYINVEISDNGHKVRTIEVDHTRAPLIRKMFETYGGGNHSLRATTRLVNGEGLRTRRGNELHRSTVEKILKDPIYCGDFRWDGRVYEGIHTPIVTKELFARVQKVFSNHNRPKQRKHDFAFTGLLTCGRCGCAVTAEIKKDKYVYYHCTGFKGNCGNSRIREEELDLKFGELVKRIEIPEDVIEWIKQALLESHRDEKVHHDRQIGSLQRQYTRLQNRLDAMYVDKLDGKISEEFYDGKSEEWRKEQEGLREAIGRHEKANINYLVQGTQILELAKKAYFLYLQQDPSEKRKLLNILLSNCTFDGGNLHPTYNRPFDMLVKNKEIEDWLPGQDSNQPGVISKSPTINLSRDSKATNME